MYFDKKNNKKQPTTKQEKNSQQYNFKIKSFPGGAINNKYMCCGN
jgi:hypothetical protein